MPPTRRLRMACDYGLSGLLRNTTFDLSLSQCRHRPQSTKVFKLRLWDARMHRRRPRYANRYVHPLAYRRRFLPRIHPTHTCSQQHRLPEQLIIPRSCSGLRAISARFAKCICGPPKTCSSSRVTSAFRSSRHQSAASVTESQLQRTKKPRHGSSASSAVGAASGFVASKQPNPPN